jgi:hypothetical protein
LEQLEREAIPARKWMIELGDSTVGQTDVGSNSGPVLTLVLPRTDGKQKPEIESTSVA